MWFTLFLFDTTLRVVHIQQMDWTSAQTRLGVKADNQPGPLTYAAYFNHIAGRDLGATADRLAAAAAIHFKKEVTTPERLSEFVANLCHETGGFRVFTENLKYSAKGALATWPSHFTATSAAKAAYNEYMIAEIAYGVASKKGVGRMGNTKPGDGFKYRGRGLLQLTGKTNYSLYGSILGLDLVGNPDLALDPFYGLQIALVYYSKNGIWKLIDNRKWLDARKAVNGPSAHGLTQVANYRNKSLALFK